MYCLDMGTNDRTVWSRVRELAGEKALGEPHNRFEGNLPDLSLSWAHKLYLRVWRLNRYNVGRKSREWRYFFSIRFGVRRGWFAKWHETSVMGEREARELYLLLKRAHQWVSADRVSLARMVERGEIGPAVVEETRLRAVDVGSVGMTPDEVIRLEIEQELKDED